MSRLHRLSRLISASQKRFIVDFVRQQSDYYYDSAGGGSNIKLYGVLEREKQCADLREVWRLEVQISSPLFLFS